MAPNHTKSVRAAVCSLVEKVAMFIVAIMAYVTMTQSDYPSQWRLEDSGFVLWRKHRKCLLIQLTPPDDYRIEEKLWMDSYWTAVPDRRFNRQPDFSSEKCGFLDHTDDAWRDGNTLVFRMDANASSMLTSQFAFEGGADRYSNLMTDYETNPGHLFLLGGAAIAVCLILDGCLVFAKSLGQGKTWAFKLVSLIPYFFYIPLTTQVSEDHQVWIRFPALYEQAATLLFVATVFIGVAESVIWIMICRREKQDSLCFTCCGMLGALLGLLLIAWVLIALYVDFTFPANLDFNFEFDFSFSFYLEILKVLTWAALVTDFVAACIFICEMRQGNVGVAQQTDEV